MKVGWVAAFETNDIAWLSLNKEVVKLSIKLGDNHISMPVAWSVQASCY